MRLREVLSLGRVVSYADTWTFGTDAEFLQNVSTLSELLRKNNWA
jgi:hypothetical protein